VRFQVLTAASMKMTVFWDVTLCSLVEVYRRFRGACCLNHQGDECHSVSSRFCSFAFVTGMFLLKCISGNTVRYRN
jgi:hypothetical protein